ARRGVEDLLETRDAALHQLALLLERELEHALVEVAVVADLVPPPCRDLRTGTGMVVRDLPRNHEGGGHVVLVEEGVDARQRRADIVIATGERTGRRQLEGAAPERLG